MAIPTNEAILATLRGTMPAQGGTPSVPSHEQIIANLPKPEMQQTMGTKSFTDFAPPHPEQLSNNIKEGLQRVVLADVNGNIIPKKSPFALASSMQGSTETVGNENTFTTSKAVGQLSEVLDRISGGLITPIAGSSFDEYKGVKIPQKFSEQVTGGAKEAFGEKAGIPIGLAIGMIGDPLNLLTGPEGVVGKAKLIRELLDARDAVAAAKVLRAAKLPEDLVSQYAEAFGPLKKEADVARGVESMIKTLETTYRTAQAEEGAQRALRVLASQQKNAAPHIINNAEKIAEQLGVGKPKETIGEAKDLIGQKIQYKTGFGRTAEATVDGFSKYGDGVMVTRAGSDVPEIVDMKNVVEVIDGADAATEKWGPLSAKIPPSPSRLYTPAAARTAKIFENSGGQTKIGNTGYELGDFGRASQARKLEIKGDRFPESELENTLKHVQLLRRASDNPTIHRFDNVAHIAVMPNGEVRAVYTRLNKSGAEEIVNWHIISNEKYLDSLLSFGTPDGTRTHNLAVRTGPLHPLSFGGTSTLAKKVLDVKGLAMAGREVLGLGAGFKKDENGKIVYDPQAGALGAIAMTVSRNPNLLKAISAETKPAAIAELLKDTFNNLGQKTLDIFSKRLAGLKRESDIEALLSSLGRLANKADLKGQTVLDDTLPLPIQQILSKKQTQLDIDLLTRQLGKTDEEGRKLSAVAQNEYDRLWEEADQKAIDRFHEANIERDILEEILSEHPGKFFTKFRLPGQAYEDFQLDEALARGMKTGGQNKNIDKFLEEQGYKSIEEAQKGMEDYLALRKRHKELIQEIRDLRGRVKSAQLVRGILDGVPIIPTKDAAEIDAHIDSATVRDFKDISGMMGQVRDIDRNFERFFGRYYPQFKRLFLNPLDDAKRALTNGIREKRTALAKDITDKFKINRGSEEAAAIQDWGERDLMNDPATANPESKYHTEEALVEKFGEKKAAEIQKAADWFRPVYDKAIQEANDVLRKIYPNNPAKLIPYRQDYFHHFQELSDGFVDAIRNFMDVPSGIDPKLIGLSEFTKPKEKFKAFAQIRKGPTAKRDAIEGYLRFMEGVEYLKHIEPEISTFRYLRRKIADVAPRSGTEVEGLKQKGVDNFLQYLDDFANDLAGKTSAADRFIQKVMPGGRATMRVLDFITNRIKANTMLGNMGTSMAQLANVPATIAETKQYSAEGMYRTLAGLFDETAPINQSTFLRERRQPSYKYDFPIDFSKHKFKRIEEEGAKVLAWMLKGGDRLGADFAWNSYYSKYLGENRAVRDGIETWNAGTSPEEAMRYADKMARRLVAGRGIGEIALAQKARLTQMVMPFTTEVNNAWFLLGDQVRKKAFGTIATYFLLNFMYNEVMEKTRGSRVTYDPINALLEGSDTFMREARKGNYGRGVGEFAGRQIGEALSNVGGGQLFSAALPDQMFGTKKSDLFGQGDPNRFGPPILAAGTMRDMFTDPFWGAAKVVSPFGSVQASKTFKGIQALLDEQVKNKSGKTSFPIAQTPENIVRAIMWGPYGTKEAHDTFATGDKLHQELAIQDAERAQQTAQAESTWSDLKDLRAKEGVAAVTEKWNSLKKDDPELFAKVKTISDDEEKGITANDRLILMLGVANGARAQYVADQINSLQTKEEKQQLWKDYAAKKIITPEVGKQIEPLIWTTGTPKSTYQPTTNMSTEGGINMAEKSKGFVKILTDIITPMGATKENKWVKNIKENALKEFPFDSLARGELADVKYTSVDFSDPGVKGEQNAGKDLTYSNTIRKVAPGIIADLAEQIERGVKRPYIKLDTDMMELAKEAGISEQQAKEQATQVLSHEMLHHLFDLSPMGLPQGETTETNPNAQGFGEHWLEDWDKIKSKHPLLQQIDRHLEESGYDMEDAYSVATERFAYLGQNAIFEDGTNAIPPYLRKYYRDVIKF